MSSQMTDSIQVFKGNPLYKQPKVINEQNIFNKQQINPAQIGKIRSMFQNNRSKVPLSSLSSYQRQMMFPLINGSRANSKSNINQNPERGFKHTLIFDNKELNYYKQVQKMNDPYNLSNSRSSMSQSLDLAGKYSYSDNNRFHRFKYAESNQRKQQEWNSDIRQQSKKKEFFKPSSLNFADQMKGII